MFQSLIGILVDFNWVEPLCTTRKAVFQSLIGILVDFNSLIPIKIAQSSMFQSLIGILVDFNDWFAGVALAQYVSIPDRDFS